MGHWPVTPSFNHPFPLASFLHTCLLYSFSYLSVTATYHHSKQRTSSSFLWITVSSSHKWCMSCHAFSSSKKVLLFSAIDWALTAKHARQAWLVSKKVSSWRLSFRLSCSAQRKKQRVGVNWKAIWKQNDWTVTLCKRQYMNEHTTEWAIACHVHMYGGVSMFGIAVPEVPEPILSQWEGFNVQFEINPDDSILWRLQPLPFNNNFWCSG